MRNPKIFDVMVVYSHNSATSAVCTGRDTSTPFPTCGKNALYNDSYAYFLEKCKENNLKAGFTTSADVTGSGRFRSCWLFENKRWKKIKRNVYSNFIFDKLSPTTEEKGKMRKMLFEDEKVQPFNSPEMFSLFFDKQRTYSRLPNFAIPTVSVNSGSRRSIKKAVSDLKKTTLAHPNYEDFSSEMVLKDRYGAGGNGIYSIGKKNPEDEIASAMNGRSKKSFILQPFAKFDKGYVQSGYSGFVDIRVIYLGKRIIQAYIRTAKKDDFRCNVHQGGSIVYISPDKIPSEVVSKSKEIAAFLDKDQDLYALDFITSNKGNVYLIEGNCGPGINWDVTDKMDVKMAKALMRSIVKSIGVRICENAEVLAHATKSASDRYLLPA